MDPAERDTILNAADAAARARDFRAAGALLERALHLAPDPATWQKLAATRRALGDLEGALGALNASLTLAPRDPVALLAKGALLEALGRDADEPYRAALAFAGDRSRFPAQLQPRFEAAARYGAAHRVARHDRFAAVLRDVLARVETDAADRVRAERFAACIADGDPIVLPGLSRTGFHDPDRFVGVAAMAAAHAVFTDEYRRLLAAEGTAAPYVDHPDGVPLDQWADLNRSTRWSAAHLLRGGVRDDDNAARCPATMAAFARVPSPAIPTRAPNLMFSILAPHTHIPPHTGVLNARLVLHVPLVIPSGCSLTVGGDRREWVPGTAMVFDDTVEHEALNGSGEVRVVLIGDVWHPDLSAVDRTVVTALMAAA